MAAGEGEGGATDEVLAIDVLFSVLAICTRSQADSTEMILERR
jgi:hypothetical protein